MQTANFRHSLTQRTETPIPTYTNGRIDDSSFPQRHSNRMMTC